MPQNLIMNEPEDDIMKFNNYREGSLEENTGQGATFRAVGNDAIDNKKNQSKEPRTPQGVN